MNAVKLIKQVPMVILVAFLMRRGLLDSCQPRTTWPKSWPASVKDENPVARNCDGG